MKLINDLSNFWGSRDAHLDFFTELYFFTYHKIHSWVHSSVTKTRSCVTTMTMKKTSSTTSPKLPYAPSQSFSFAHIESEMSERHPDDKVQ